MVLRIFTINFLDTTIKYLTVKNIFKILKQNLILNFTFSVTKKKFKSEKNFIVQIVFFIIYNWIPELLNRRIYIPYLFGHLKVVFNFWYLMHDKERMKKQIYVLQAIHKILWNINILMKIGCNTWMIWLELNWFYDTAT